MVCAGFELSPPTLVGFDGQWYIGLSGKATELGAKPAIYYERRRWISNVDAWRLIVFFEKVGIDLERLTIDTLPVFRISNFDHTSSRKLGIL